MSTTTSTTTAPSYEYLFGVPRKSGLTYTAADKVPVVLPTASATDMDPFSLKTYVPFDNRLAIFDGAGENKIDDMTSVYSFSVIAPENTPSFSTTTSTTSTTTTTTTTTTSTSTTTSTTT